MAREKVYLAEIDYWDPGSATVKTLRFSTGLGFMTKPTDTPANVFFDGRLKEPGAVKRDAFDSGTVGGPSRSSIGDTVIMNGDRLYDDILGYGVDGRRIKIWRGYEGAAFPAGFTTHFVGTMEQVLMSDGAATIKTRGRESELSVPLQPAKYAGTNVLPAGLEGVAADLKGKPKPVAYGVISNVPTAPVNTPRLIHQVKHGPVSSVAAVYDSGVALNNAGVAFWTQRRTSAGQTLLGICHDGALYVAVGHTAGMAAVILTSPDCITWTARVAPGAAAALRGVCYSAYLDLFVAVGAGGYLITSPDGITWTVRASTFASDIARVTWSDDLRLYVAIGWLGGGVATSPNGTAWTQHTTGITSVATAQFEGVACGNALVTIVGSQSAAGIIYTTSDGITWTKRTVEGFNVERFWNIAFSPTLGWLAGAHGYNAIGTPLNLSATSVDGYSYVLRGSMQPSVVPAPDFQRAMTFGSGIYVAIGGSMVLGSSLDGMAWSEITPFGAYNQWDVLFAGTSFVSVGSDGCIYQTTSTPYASLAALEDDTLAPMAGHWNYYAAGGYFRLGSSPAGQVTADVIEGAAGGDRTHAQVFKRMLIDAGYSGADYSAADIAALDVQNSSVIGYFTRSETSRATALTEVAGSASAWWGPDRLGVFRIQRMSAPSGSPVLSLTANDLKRPLERLAPVDSGKGQPTFAVTVLWGRNYTVQTGELAAIVPDDRRAIVSTEWREATYTDASVQTAHPLARHLIVESLFTTETDALAEATRLQGLFGVRRDRYQLVLELNDETAAADLFNVVQLTADKFDLTTGKLFRVLGVDPIPSRKEVTLTVWG